MTDEPKTRSGTPAEGDKAASSRPATRAGKTSSTRNGPVDRRILGIAAAAVAGIVVGLLLGALFFGGDGDEGEVVAASDAGPRIVNPQELVADAKSLGRPVYWAGPQEGSEIELERDPEGAASVRYIPEGEDPDGPAADYLTVVTYPYPEAYEALQLKAAQGGTLSRELPDGGFMISQPDQPTNAYLAYKGEDYQVEIYDPRPGQALKLVVDGVVVRAE